jgi:D-glycero-beta-D-manno-heptose-7-phosphate kinase
MEIKSDLADLIDAFQGKKICIIGDLIADIFVFGRPYRLSREAPVVVIEYENERLFPGSAGNTINNLLALGAQVYPITFVGNDGPGDRLVEYFSQFPSMDIEGLMRYVGQTVSKTRILAGDTHTSKQQVIRIDRDSRRRISIRERNLMIQRLKDLSPSMDAFVLSDYGHGAVNNTILSVMRDLAKDRIVVGDSRYNLRSFRGLTLITPNESEAYHLASLDEGASIENVGKKIMAGMSLKALLITRGNKGMNLFLEDGRSIHIPISGSDQVTDVTGAGDTVCATVALALAAGADFHTASLVANHAAGVVVMKRGTATVTVGELRDALQQQ